MAHKLRFLCNLTSLKVQMAPEFRVSTTTHHQTFGLVFFDSQLNGANIWHTEENELSS